MQRIHKTAEAEHDLMNIWSYTYKNWGDVQADLYLDRLENTIFLLSENPMISVLREEFIRPVRIHLTGHHLIVYESLPDRIIIVRVLHKSMDVEIHLE